eukprot:3727350-Amphidinium_carterae.1
MVGAGMLVTTGKLLVPSVKAATPLDKIVRMAASDSTTMYTEMIDRERFTQYIDNTINRRYMQWSLYTYGSTPLFCFSAMYRKHHRCLS